MAETTLTKQVRSQIPPEAYDCIPGHCRDSVRAYVETGQPVGEFLQSVIANDLSVSVCRADDVNIHRLADYVKFFWNYAPVACWGSRDKYQQWIERHREERKKNKHE